MIDKNDALLKRASAVWPFCKLELEPNPLASCFSQALF